MEPRLRASRAAKRTWIVALLGLWSGCAYQDYEAEPLGAYEIVHALAAERDSRATEVSGSVLSLEEATRLLRQRNPSLREAFASYASALAVANIETPLPNPRLGIGPEFGFGSDVTTKRVQPGMTFSVPIATGGKLGAEDRRNRARAEAARAAALELTANLELELRRRYRVLAVARIRLARQRAMIEAAERSYAAARILVDAGGASALDVSLFGLERSLQRARAIEAESDATEAEARLAELLALDSVDQELEVPASSFSNNLSLEELRELVAAGHPQLERLAAEYALAEARYELEIARQVPNLVLGGEAGNETGESRSIVAFTLGAALPIFDRNQQAIARAKLQRDEARVRFRAASDRILTEVARAHRQVRLAAERRRVMDGEVLPAAQTNAELARRSLGAGSAQALAVLDAERSLREVELAVLDAELSTIEAWSDLERATGMVLESESFE